MAIAVHVTRHSDGFWSIKRSDTGEVLATRPWQSAAEEEGRRLAKRLGCRLIVHGKDGRVRFSRDYGSVTL